MAGIPLPPIMRKSVLTLAMLASLSIAGLSLAGCQGRSGDASSGGGDIMIWSDLLSQPKPKADAQIAYGDDPLQIVDVWIPKGDLPRRAVIMIHGGCWQTDIAERDIMNYIANDLREAGIGVWNIEYRGVDRTGGGYPGTYQDVAAAADLFAKKGPDYGFSTRKVVVIGHSAGGHLALWLAARPNLPLGAGIRGENPIKIDAAISQGGLPDLREGARRTGHACGTDAPAKMAANQWGWTSPPEMPIGDAVQILFNNDRDAIAPPEYAHAYQAHLASQGVNVEAVVTKDEGHVELIAPNSKSWAAQKARIIELLTLD